MQAGKKTKKNGPIAKHNLEKQIHSEQLKKQAYEMRIMGYRTSEISERLGITPVYVCRIIREGLEKARAINLELSEKILDIELESLQKLEPVYFEQAVQGDYDALASVLKIKERRAKLLGLDSKEPIQLDVGIKGYEISEKIEWPPPQSKQ